MSSTNRNETRHASGMFFCTNQQPLQRGSSVPNHVWVGLKWLLAFPRVPVTSGTSLKSSPANIKLAYCSDISFACVYNLPYFKCKYGRKLVESHLSLHHCNTVIVKCPRCDTLNMKKYNRLTECTSCRDVFNRSASAHLQILLSNFIKSIYFISSVHF